MKGIRTDFKNLGADSGKIGLILVGHLIVLILVVFAFYNFYPKITSLLDNIDSVGKDIAAFTAKAQSLKVIKSKLPEDMVDIQIVIPEGEPVLFLFTNIKDLAAENKLIFKPPDMQVSSGVSEKVPLTTSTMLFTVEGEKKDIISFVSKVKEIAPATTINSLDFEKYSDGTVISSALSLAVYSAPLPKEIPTGKSAIGKISPEEEGVIEEILSLKKPKILEYKPEQKNDDPVDPFVGILQLSDQEPEERSLE